MMKPFFAFLALFVFLAALWPVATGCTAAQPEPCTGEPPIVADKLPGEDKPAEGSAELTIGEPLGEFKLTAYCPCAKCCGKTDGITATGTLAAEGRTIAVDPRVIPYGSSVTIYFADGTVHTYTAEDCGGAPVAAEGGEGGVEVFARRLMRVWKRGDIPLADKSADALGCII